MTEVRKGSQKPRIDIYRDGDITLAEKTIALLDYYGIHLMPWQKATLRRWMAVDENGKWANADCGLAVPRQNGKTELIIARIIGGMVFLGEALVYTAQSVNTVEEIKRRVLRFFYDADQEVRDLLTPEFDKEPKSLDYVELRNRGRCLFRTRTRTSGLGTTNDVMIIDEAQEQSDAEQEAMLPTISAGKKQNHQTILAGTPPTAGSAGTVFVRTRRNVLGGKTDSWCWREWSVENITAVDDVEAWYATNPSLGYYVMRSAIEKEAASMAQDSFNKMRLGWFVGVDSQRVITDDEWAPLAVDKVVLPDDPSLVYSVKFSPDRSSVTLAVGVLMPDSRIHVEVVERRRMSDGIAWLVQWLLLRWRKAAKIIVDGAAGAPLLVEELVRADRRISKRILTPNTREAGAAYAGFLEAVKHGLLTHFDQPVLNSAIRTAKRRDIGRDGMFGFAPLNPQIQCDPVDAIAFAYYGATKYHRQSGGSTQRVMV